MRFWKALGLYFNNLQKLEKLQKAKYLLQNLVMKQKIAQIATFYTFFKSPWPSKFNWAKTFAKFLKHFCVLMKKWNYANSIYRHLHKNMCKISSQKNLQSGCFCHRLSKELYNVEIQWLEVGLNINLVLYW